MKGFFFAVLSVLLLALAGEAVGEAASLEAELAYDAARPLDVKVVGVEKKGSVTITDVTFGSVAGNPPIEAYVVRPESGAGPFAGDNFIEFYKAAPDSKRIATYSSGHAMDAEIIRHDRDAWLAEQLGI